MEIEPWEESGQSWRRMLVKLPKDIATHSKEQVIYIDQDGLIRRLDYKVEIAGNVSAAAHYLSGYQDIQGLKIATKRTVYSFGNDNKPQLDAPIVVSIEWTNIKYS